KLAASALHIAPCTLARHFLLGVEEFDFVVERGVGGDGAVGADRAIAQFRRDDQLALAADFHSDNSLVQALDDQVGPELEDQRFLALDRAVELGASLTSLIQPAGVM